MQAVTDLAQRLTGLGWVTDLWVAGSLATGDHRPGVSDLDLVARCTGPVGDDRTDELSELHRNLDNGSSQGLDLGCAYVDAAGLHDTSSCHPTWTHGRLVQRELSLITRAELARHGYAVLGQPPSSVLPPVTDDDVRRAARAELCGYWVLAARHAHWFLDPVMADLGLTSMARGRHTLATGQLLTKSDAIRSIESPAWLVAQVQARRDGFDVSSPRVRAAAAAWRDVRRTTRAAARSDVRT